MVLANFNYEYGHADGDEILKQVAQIISQAIPPVSEAFRSGGDEFVVLIAESDLLAVVSVAEQIRKSVESQFSSKSVRRKLCSFDFSVCVVTEASPTLTCGIAFYPKHGTDLSSLLKAASDAMYQGAKQLGGNKVALAPTTIA